VSPDKLKNLFPVGMLSLSAGLILHNFLHTRYSEFAAGVLIGMSIVLMIAGLRYQKKRSGLPSP